MFAAPGPTWRITQGCDLIWRAWDGEHVAFNTGSGDTHLLDNISAETLKRIESAPATQRELESWIARQINPNSIQDVPGHIDYLLKQLHSLGLIESVAQ